MPRAGEAQDVVVGVRARGDEGPVAVDDEVRAAGGQLECDLRRRLRHDARLLHLVGVVRVRVRVDARLLHLLSTIEGATYVQMCCAVYC